MQEEGRVFEFEGGTFARDEEGREICGAVADDETNAWRVEKEWSVDAAGRRVRVWAKAPPKQDWVLVNSEEAAESHDNMSWSTRLFNTAVKGLSVLNLRNYAAANSSANANAALRFNSVPRIRALNSLLRLLLTRDELMKFANELEKAVFGAAERKSVAPILDGLRDHISQVWKETVPEAAKEICATVKKLASVSEVVAKKDGSPSPVKGDDPNDEFVASTNLLSTIQTCLFQAQMSLEAASTEDVKTDEAKTFVVSEKTPSGQTIVVNMWLYDDVLVRGSGDVMYPLDWIWVAHNKEKRVTKLVTLNSVFVFVADEDVLRLIRVAVSKYLSKVHCVSGDGLRKVRFICPEFSYFGDAKNGTMHGRGVLEMSGWSYSGLFELGKRNGKGVYIKHGPDGETYKGYFREDMREGRGVVHYSAQHPERAFKFIGHWKKNIRDGMGMLYRLDGSSLKCNWVNDSPSSPVTLIHPSGSMYVGGWADGKPTGFGIESSSDVGRYYGEFLNGARSGRGAFEAFRSPYFVLSGMWLNGALAGKGQIDIPGVCLLQGNFAGLTEATMISPNVVNQGSFCLNASPPTAHLGRWELFVQLRFNGGPKNTVPTDCVAKEAAAVQALPEDRAEACKIVLGSSAYFIVLEEFVFLHTALCDRDVHKTPASLIPSQQDYHLFTKAFCFHTLKRLSKAAGVAGFNSDQSSAFEYALETALETMLMARSSYQKMLFAMHECPAEDLRIDKWCQSFVKQQRKQRAKILMHASLYDRFCAVADKEEPLAGSIAAFSELPMLFCPREKLKCLERWVDAANAAQELKLEGLDDLLPCLIYSASVACVPSLRTEKEFLWRFLCETDRNATFTSGRESYVWTTFESVVSYCENAAEFSKKGELSPRAQQLLVIEMADDDAHLRMNNSFKREQTPAPGQKNVMDWSLEPETTEQLQQQLQQQQQQQQQQDMVRVESSDFMLGDKVTLNEM